VPGKLKKPKRLMFLCDRLRFLTAMNTDEEHLNELRHNGLFGCFSPVIYRIGNTKPPVLGGIEVG
jgi:hypothetical protein